MAMNCPACQNSVLESTLTREGVEVDACRRCGGVWLDRGELALFSRSPSAVATMMRSAASTARPSARISPKTGRPMQSLTLPGGVVIERCPDTEGLWLDAGELTQALRASQAGGVSIRFDRPLEFGGQQPSAPAVPAPAAAMPGGADGEDERTGFSAQQQRLAAIAGGMRPLPSLTFRSAAALVLLYGPLGLILLILAESNIVLPGIAVLIGVGTILLHYLLGPFIMDLSLNWMYRMHWLDPQDLPPHLRAFVRRICQERGIRHPRFGLIDDGAPNAFTYGHHPSNARIILTRGILELLDEKEVEAVTAHEIGHVVHWDMVMMTLAAVVPLLLYYAYRTALRVAQSSRGSGRNQGQAAAAAAGVAIAAYILYIVSEYIVLWFSRTREYYADRFAGECVGDPSALAGALVKIAYGLVSSGSREQDEEARKRRPAYEAVGALGIFDAASARAMAVASFDPSTSLGAAPAGGGPTTAQISKANVRSAMKWDLWNPWAWYYELHSTHPLVAKRLQMLAEQSAAAGREPYIVFDLQQPESYWDEFFVDVFVNFLPTLAGIAAVAGMLATHNVAVLGIGLIIAGCAAGLKTRFKYPTSYFPELGVSSLLKKVKVSGVRPVPCRMRGTVIGRGVPGYIASEDFVMRDSTGIMFLDYRQPLRIWEFLFGLLRAGDFRGQEVEITGWYRRSPMPFVELQTMTVGGTTRRCYVYYLHWATAAVLAGLGGFILAAVATGSLPTTF